MTFSLGLNVGASRIAVTLLDADGTILRAESVSTDVAGGDAVVAQIRAIVAEHAAESLLAGVGLSVPDDVDPANGLIVAPSIGWAGVDIAARIAPHLPKRTRLRVENDTNAAAWAEYRFGGHPRADSFAMIAVGPGIAGGFVLNGRLLRGAAGAGEIGHLQLKPAGENCPCGSTGCWEQYASEGALYRAAVAMGWGGMGAGRAMLAAAATDPAARAVVEGTAAHLVRGISLIVDALNPDTVLLGGGLGADPRFVAVVKGAFEATEFSPPRLRPTLRAAVLGPFASAIGAAALAQDPA